jgi:hypothetical protein
MIRIGEPATTIDTPLEHLTACHRRIEDRLATLGRAADHWGDASEAAWEAIRKTILFLDSNGALHTMDEELRTEGTFQFFEIGIPRRDLRKPLSTRIPIGPFKMRID